MKTKLTKLAFAALLVSSSSIALNSNVTLADQGGSVVGDLAGYGEEAYFGEDAAYTEESTFEAQEQYGDAEEDYQYVDQVGHAERSIVQPASHEIVGSGCSGGCGDTSCGGGCSEMSCNSDRGLGRRFKKRRNSCDHRSGWGRMELLGWWTQSQDSAPLILQSAAGTIPTLNEPTAVSVFGDDLNGEISAGFRGDVGLWLSENVGIGGRFWTLADNNDSFFFQGNGDNQSIGRSFFNTDSQPFIGFSGDEDSVLVAFTGIAVPNVTGTISALSELDLWATEAYARLRFGGTSSCRLDFIGGYSHFDIENNLNITSNSVIVGGALAGNFQSFTDNFDTENEFNGGQLGFELVMNRGRWTASSLTKVHIGNMSQSATASGSFATGVVGAAPTTTLSEGVLAGVGPNNFERDVFSFIPEANFKLGYQLCSRAQFSVGYSFLYFDNVALAGDVIDRLVDGSALGTGGVNNNGIETDDSSLFVQGIDLGLTITF